MSLTLGLVPQDLSVMLARDASFVSALEAPDDWPTGTVIELRFHSPTTEDVTVWAADIVGTLASWNLPDTAAAEVLDAGQNRVRLVCIDPEGRELLWARGYVRDA